MSDHDLIVLLERQNADRQERINRAVRDLDHLIKVAANKNEIPLYQELVEAQKRLRGK